MPESGTERDGFLSYSVEWHAFAHGVYAGLRKKRPKPKGLPENEDVQREPAYYKGGFVLGTLLQAALVIAGAAFGLGVI
jgi:hypothetical protein